MGLNARTLEWVTPVLYTSYYSASQEAICAFSSLP